jgi:hypothetical protein
VRALLGDQLTPPLGHRRGGLAALALGALALGLGDPRHQHERRHDRRHEEDGAADLDRELPAPAELPVQEPRKRQESGEGVVAVVSDRRRA